MIGTGGMQPFECLVDDLHLRTCPGGGKQFRHLGRDFLVGERRINLLHMVYGRIARHGLLLLGFLVGVEQDGFHPPVH